VIPPASISDFVGRLQRVVDGPVPCGVVNHVANTKQPPKAPDSRWYSSGLTGPSQMVSGP
jgi:hypothetical protein